MADESHDHDHDGHEGHDHDAEAAGPDLELARQRLARLDAAMTGLSAEVIDEQLRRSKPAVRQSVVRHLRMKLDPRFLKGGVGKLVRTRIPRLSIRDRLELAADLTSALDDAGIELLGEASFESPTNEELGRLVDHLLDSFPAPIVRAYLACTAAAEAPVAEELDRILDEDPRLAEGATAAQA